MGKVTWMSLRLFQPFFIEEVSQTILRMFEPSKKEPWKDLDQVLKSLDEVQKNYERS